MRSPISAAALRLELAKLTPEERAALREKLAYRAQGKPLYEEPTLRRRPREGGAPLSFAQQRLWFLEQLMPGSSVYNLPSLARLKGRLDVGVLRRALEEVVRRHEVLRTTIASVEGEPRQIVHPECHLPFCVIDVSGVAEREAVARAVLTQEAVRPFDLERGPLVRAMLVRLSGEEHILGWMLHHIVSDGWSSNLLVTELCALYEAYREGRPSPLPELELQYGDYAVWQREWLTEGRLAEQLEYWRKQLGGVEQLALPVDRVRAGQPGMRGERVGFRLGRELTKELKRFSRENGATLFMTLLAGLQALLGRYTGQSDIAVGSPIANRTRREIEPLMGFFVNTLVLRSSLHGGPGLRELVGRVRETTLGAYAHQDMPFERLVEALQPERELSRHPLFQVMFVVQSGGMGRGARLRELEMERYEVGGGGAKFDLSVTIGEAGEELAGTLEYSVELFERRRMERMAGHLEEVLGAGVKEPERDIWELELMSAGEREQVAEWNRTGMELERKGVHRLIEEQAEKDGEREAVRYGEAGVSYRELNGRANRLARQLREKGVGRGSRVGVALERGVELVVGLLGVLKAGGAYVPLDVEYPEARLRWMVEDAEPEVIVSGGGARGKVEGFGREVVEVEEAGAGYGEENLAEEAGGADAAYLIYTSGSTGEPKGSLLPHMGLANLVRWRQRDFPLTSKDRVLQTYSFSFDASTWEFFWPLSVGCPLYMLKPGGEKDAAHLVRLIREEAITVIGTVPSMLRVLLEEPGIERCPSLRHVFCGGEALHTKLYERFRSRLSAQLHNMYGPTEASVDTSCWTCGPSWPGEVLPIGHSIPHKPIYVLDRNGKRVPPGLPGELYVGGPGLAIHYHKRPGLTASRFLPDPFGGPGRLYRTGDMCRLRDDGVIEFLGRADLQVKIRGHRIELGELEGVLAGHEAIADCVVADFSDSRGQKRLACYVAFRTARKLSWAEVRGWLQERVPDYMIPSGMLVLERLPRNANGKIDRQALPAPRGFAGQREYVAPRTAAEEMVASVYEAVLNVERVGAADHFFELGGHSLLATQAVSRLREAFRLEVPLRELFEAPEVAALAGRLETLRRTSTGLEPLQAIPRAQRSGPVPLSFAQQRLWFLEQLQPGGAAYHIPMAVRLRGELDAAVLQRALGEIVRRHEALRTTFVSTSSGPVQQVHPYSGLPQPLLDVSGMPEGEAVARAVLTQEAVRPFDLERGPLVRAMLVRLSGEEHILGWMLHHIVSDGWSSNLLVTELCALYEAYREGRPSPLPELELQYGDYAVWQRDWLTEGRLAEQLEYWRKQLGGVEQLALPVDRVRAGQPGMRGERVGFRLGAELTKELKRFSRENGATLFMTLLAGLQALLGRYTGQSDIAVGSPIANRTRREIEPLMGFFVNTLVLRSSLHGGPGLRELVGRVRETTLGAYAHQDMPFERLVEALQPERELSRHPLFQVMFVVQSGGMGRGARLRELEMERYEVGGGGAKFDLSVTIGEAGEELAGTLEYSVELFERRRMERMAGHLEEVLGAGVKEPERDIWELELMSAGEREQVAEWNRTGMELERKGVHRLIEEQAEKDGEREAVRYGEAGVSYRELNGRANRLARQLREKGVGRGSRVGVALERGVELVVGLLGVLKAGGAYVPLDVEYPEARLRWMVEDAEPEVIVSGGGARGKVEGFGREVVEVEEAGAGYGEENLAEEAGGADAAYLIYTSGSTGEPKGVVVEHRQLSNAIEGMGRQFGFRAGDRMACLAAQSFDIFLFEVLTPLAHGGTVWLRGRGEALERGQVRETLAWSTQLHAVPGLMREMVRGAEGRQYRQMRGAYVGGERVPVGLVEAMQEVFPEAEVHVLYGPTEATMVASSYRARRGAGVREGMIGRGLPNQRLMVAGANGAAVPVGLAGEIWISGAGVSRGYWRREEMTASGYVEKEGERYYRSGDMGRWVEEEGGIQYLGRRDGQVKIRGHRIEPGEVERVLAGHAGVGECAVVARADGAGNLGLAAYVAPREGSEAPTAGELRRWLEGRLPGYMIPSRFAVVDALPRNANGKLDAQALVRIEPDRPEQHASENPSTEIAQIVAGIWSELLGCQSIPASSNFFELGGHSLLATRLIGRVRETLGCELSLRTLFEMPFLGSFTAAVERAVEALAGVELPPIGKSLRLPMLPVSPGQQRLWFLDQIEPGSASRNIPVNTRIRGRLDLEALRRAFEAMVERHEILRTRIVAVQGVAMQTVDPPGRFELPFIDLRTLPVEARERGAHNLAIEQGRAPFRLESDLMLRARLARIDENEYILLVTLAHIASDGWSVGIFGRELSLLYNAFSESRPAPLPPLPLQYADYAVWMQRLMADPAHLEFWSEKLRGAPYFELPRDRDAGQAGGPEGSIHTTCIRGMTVASLRSIARQQGATLFMALLAGWKALLRFRSGSDDVIVGTDVAGRPRPELEGLIGFFVNQVVLRTSLAGNPPFTELISRVRQTAIEAFVHEFVSFKEVVDQAAPKRDLRRSPLFQIKIVFQNTPAAELMGPGLSARPLATDIGTAQFDLTIFLDERQDELRIALQYRTGWFAERSIKSLADQYAALLEAVAVDPGMTLEQMEAKLMKAGSHDVDLSPADRSAKLRRLRSTSARAIAVPGEQEIVDVRPLDPARPALAIVTPAIDHCDLPALAEHNPGLIESRLAAHGALLFRGFTVRDAADFDAFITAICKDLYRENGEHDRTSVSPNIYTPVAFSPEKKLLWHNENSFNQEWPGRIWFCCLKPAESGGETPLADSHLIYQRLDPAIREAFAERGILYVRNYDSRFGLDWPKVFQTASKKEVEARCAESGNAVEWKQDGRLRTRCRRPAIIANPATGKPSFFGQPLHWHPACLDLEVRKTLTADLGDENLPRNCYYGDGSPIEDSAIEHLCSLYREAEIFFPWQAGDILMVDNVAMAHARNPYSGDRRLLVAMGAMGSFSGSWRLASAGTV